MVLAGPKVEIDQVTLKLRVSNGGRVRSQQYVASELLMIESDEHYIKKSKEEET